jgi:hypothetical protein
VPHQQNPSSFDMSKVSVAKTRSRMTQGSSKPSCSVVSSQRPHMHVEFVGQDLKRQQVTRRSLHRQSG